MCMLGASAPGAAVEFPEINGASCCYGAANSGAQGCTCWRPIYDLAQTDPDTSKMPLPRVPVRMCEPGPGDEGCAYRPHSPERDGEDGYQGDADDLDHLAATGQPFYCHSGMRRIIGWYHPEAGIAIPGHHAAYDPPIVEAIPYQADGTPGLICSGWLLRAMTHQRHRDQVAS